MKCTNTNIYTDGTGTFLTIAFDKTAINMKGHVEKVYTLSQASSRVPEKGKLSYPDVFPQLLDFIISLITRWIINMYLTIVYNLQC